jgi:hypothetical protein
MSVQSKSAFSLRARLILAMPAGALLGAVMAALSPGSFWAGWLAAALLFIFGLLALLSAWNWAGRGRALGWMIALAFLLRLAVGVGLSYALPEWGYSKPEQQAGYLFKDAYNRDREAWNLAQSDKPLWASFRQEFVTDQYGGVLALSALVYRYISPDAQRPFLILILGALTVAFGLPFLVQAVRLRWPVRAAVLAGWIYVLYPDAIFFTSAQMREPFLIGLGAVAFWAVLALNRRSPAAWLALVASLLLMAVISSRVAAAVTGFLALLFLIEHVMGRQGRRWQAAGWLGFAAGILLLLAFSWDWFHSSTSWDISLTQSDSGWIAKLIEEAADVTGISRERLGPLVVITYGLARPVLPAAIAEPAESALWKTIVILRSVGWYGLAPFIVYALFTVWKEASAENRRRAIWLALMVMLWVLIASARGGGDATDNPRYRVLFIPWLALLAAWAVDWALTHRDAWIWRWILVEVIFLAFSPTGTSVVIFYSGTVYPSGRWLPGSLV